MEKVYFIVSKTYAEITPESVEYGEFDDHGFVWEDVEYDFRDLVNELISGKWHREETNPWLSSGWYTIDYREGREQEENLHIKCPNARSERYYRLACEIAGVTYVR